MALRDLARRAGMTASEAAPLIAHLSRNEAASGTARLLVSGSGPQAHVIGASAARELQDRARAALAAYHQSNPLRPGMPLEELRERSLGGIGPAAAAFVLERLVAEGAVRIVKETISLSGHSVTLSDADQRALAALESAFLKDGLNPRTPEEAAAAEKLDLRHLARMMHLLLAEGKLVKIKDGRVFHSRAIEELKARLWELRASRPIMDIGFFKELTGTSRKNAIPLLEHLDAARVTRRVGSDREILPPARG
jgi:selenocysteine-specific elongation factor